MSKIFEALKRLEGETGGTLVPGLGGAQMESEQTEPSMDAGPSGIEELLEPLPPEPAELAPLWEPGNGIRTLPLQVPQLLPVLPYDGKVADWSVSEQYRIIRTRILQNPRRPAMMVVSSPGPGDGKSVTAVNLAGVFALKSAANVLLVDGDVRRSTIHSQIGLSQSPGLAEVLEQSAMLEEALIHTQQFPNLYVLTAGKRHANPAELLDSPQWVDLCKQLRKLFAYIIIDSPPMAAVADYDLIQEQCDGVVLVVRPDHTRRDLCFKALETIPQQKLIGVVVNCVDNWFLSRTGYQDSYYYRDYAAGE